MYLGFCASRSPSLFAGIYTISKLCTVKNRPTSSKHLKFQSVLADKHKGPFWADCWDIRQGFIHDHQTLLELIATYCFLSEDSYNLLLLFHAHEALPTQLMYDKKLQTICHSGACRKKIPGRALGCHLLLSSTIMTSLWKLCPRIWLCVTTDNELSAIWESQHVCFPTPLWKLSEEVLETVQRHTGKRHVLYTDLLPLVVIFGTKKKKTECIIPLVRQYATLKISACFLIWH